MGPFANKPIIKAAGWVIASAIIGLNITLLYLTFAGKV
jgi:Mn2+/Fe2+ NRAMP family transporter